MTKLTVAFHKFANAPKNRTFEGLLSKYVLSE
jgi:hypothetical protein